MTDLSRRGLLGAAFFGVVIAPFVDSGEAVAARLRSNLYSRTRFHALHGRKFQMVGSATRTSLRLVRISDLQSMPHGDEHRFSVTFRATKAGPPQGTYTLRRRGFKATELFVVPDAGRRTYVAVVNQSG